MTTAPQLSRHVLQTLSHDPVRSDLSDTVAVAAMSLNSAGQFLNKAITNPRARAAVARHIRRLAGSIEQVGAS